MRKVKDIIRILFSNSYITITKNGKKGMVTIRMDKYDAENFSFILSETVKLMYKKDSAVREVNEIINN